MTESMLQKIATELRGLEVSIEQQIDVVNDLVEGRYETERSLQDAQGIMQALEGRKESLLQQMRAILATA